jgi:chemotaxis protein CheC
MSLPEVLHGRGDDLFVSPSGAPDGLVLFLYINFSVRDRDIRGYIAMLMDLPSLAALKVLIADFIARVTADAD